MRVLIVHRCLWWVGVQIGVNWCTQRLMSNAPQELSATHLGPTCAVIEVTQQDPKLRPSLFVVCGAVFLVVSHSYRTGINKLNAHTRCCSMFRVVAPGLCRTSVTRASSQSQ